MNARRGSALAIVLWAVSFAALVASSLQVAGFRQAVLGREALSRVQARWAARAGVETMISIMDYHTELPDADDAMTLVRDMESSAFGELDTGTFDIRHVLDGVEWAGPLDEHARMNLNAVQKDLLANISDMSSDVADAIVDWRDSDSDEQPIGAESDFYLNRGMGYGPRNASFRSVAELELVAGAFPTDVRGEDWDLDNRLDPNEDDGDLTWPEDSADHVLQGGWARLFTTASRQTGRALDGEIRINLKNTTVTDLVAGIPSISTEQAAALIQFAGTSGARMETLIAVPLSSAIASGSTAGGNSAQGATSAGSGRSGRSSSGRSGSGQSNTANSPLNLTQSQLAEVLRYTTLEEFLRPGPGRINVNSVTRDVLVDLFGLSSRTADNLLSRRDAKREGFTSVLDLLEVDGMDAQWLATYGRYLDVISDVYTITSKGRALSNGAECEMIVTVDRSVSPTRILSYREQ